MLLLVLFLLGFQSALAQITSTTTGGNWNNTTTWIGGVVPGNNADVIIDGPVTLNVNSATLRSLTINASVTFTTLGTNTLAVTGGPTGTITVNGTLQRNSTGAMTFDLMVVNSGGTYVHNVDNVTLPTAAWNNGSLCNVSGVAGNDLTGEEGQSFHHFTWSSTNTAAVNITPSAISGNLEVTAGGVGTNFFRVSTTPITVTSLSLSGTSNMQIASGGTSRVLNVTGDFVLSSGTLTMSTGATGTLNVAGNFSHTGGTITRTGGTGNINFIGTGTQIYASGGTVTATAINYTVNAGSTLQMADPTTTLGGTAGTFSIGTFTLGNTATLGVTSTDGITTAGATGNIRVTGTRTYSNGANYIFNGTTNQNSGDGLSQNTPNNVTINNPGNSVRLSATTTIGGSLNIITGNFDALSYNTTVSGPTTVNATGNYTAGSGTQTLNGGLTLSGGTFAGSTGTVDATNVTLSSGIMTAPSGSFLVSGDWVNNGAIVNPNSGIVSLDGAVQSISGSTAASFYNLSIAGSSTKTSTTAITIGGNLSIGNGISFNANESLTVNGTTAVGSGVSGNLVLSTTGDKVFDGQVQIFSGATWNNAANEDVTFRGGITKAATGIFMAGTGSNTFDTNSQALTGTFSIPNVVVNGVSLTNVNSLTVANSLSGSGVFTQSTNSSLTLSGTATVATLNATDPGNTVIYNGNTQTIKSGQYHNLTINQSGGTDATLGGNVAVSNTLTLTAGKIIAGVNSLTMGSAAMAIAGASTTRYIDGNLEWNLPSGASVRVFEIGDAVYTPVTLNTASVIGSVNVTASSTVGNHPNENTPVANSSGINQAQKVDHFFTLTKSGGGSISANATFDFTNTSNTGAAASYVIKRYEGTPNYWTALPSSTAVPTISTAGGLTAFGDFQIGVPNTPPAITTDPVSASVCQGGSVTFTVIASGIPPGGYQWRKGGVNITGATSDSFTINPVTLSDAANYDVVVTNLNGSATSAPATLTVNPQPTLSAVLQNIPVCDGNAAIISLTGLLPSTTFTVNYSINAVAQASIAGVVSNAAGIATFSTPLLTFANNGQALEVTGLTITTPATNCAQVFTQSTTLTVNALPTDKAVAGTSPICSGSSVNITVAASDAGVNYQLRNDADNSLVGAPVAGTGALINLPTGALTATTTFNILATNASSGCSFELVTTPTVSVRPLPVFQTLSAPLGTSYCQGSPNITVRVNATENGLSYQLYKDGLGGALQLSTGASLDFTGLDAGVYTVRAFYGTLPACETMMSNSITVTENILPAVTSSSTQTLCSGSALNYVPTSAVSGTVFNWTSGLVAGVSGNTAVGSGTITDVLTNSTSTTQVVTYVITPEANGCSGTPFNLMVTVEPTISASVIIAPVSQTICSGGNFVIDVNTSSVPSAGTMVYDYSSVATGGVTGFSASGTGVLYTTDITQAGPITNPTNVRQTITYTITPRVNGGSACVGSVITVVINVDPTPAMSTSLDRIVCSDAVSGITLNTNGVSVSASSYTINSITPDIPFDASWMASGSNQTTGSGKTASSIASDIYTNTGSANRTVTYNVTPISSSGCVGSAQNILVTVRPEPVVSSLLSATVCSDGAAGITLSTSGSIAAASYTINSITVASGLTPATGNATSGSGRSAAAIQGDRFTNLTNSPLTVTYAVNGVSSLGCLGDVVVIVLTVNPEPVLNAGLNKTVCSDAISNITLTTSASSVGASGYILNSVTPSSPFNGTTWLAGGANAALGNISATGILSDVYSNLTSAILSVTYNITPVNGSCAGDPFNVTLSINPEPVGINATTVVCSDVAIGYNIINNVAIQGNNVGATFIWYTMDNPNVTGESIAPVAGGSITDIVTNVTNTNQVVTYNVIPTSVIGCVGQVFQVSVTVNPEPVGITSSTIICSDETVGYNLQANVNSGNNLSSTFNWVAAANANVTGESTLTRNGSLIDDILVNSTNSPEVVIYTITPYAQTTGCIGNIFTISVTVNPRAKISAGIDLALCEDNPSIALQGSINYAPNGVIWSGGTGTFDNSALPTANYFFNNPSEVNTQFTLNLRAIDPDGAGPCPEENDQMVLRINPLPIVVFTGLPAGAPPQLAENNLPITLTGNQVGGIFTISPTTSNIGSTTPNPVDRTSFDPGAVTLGSNFITYTYTNSNGCTNFNTQEVIVNPVTTVDFALQGAALNADGDFEICAEAGLVRLLGFPVASSGLPPETQFVSIPAFVGGPTATIVKIGVDYFIETNGLASNTYRIRYDYKNAFGAITFRIRDVRVFASPRAIFTSANNCIASDVVFTDQSTIDATPFPTNIATWGWTFGDGDISANQNPSKRYALSNTYGVVLRVTTLQGCSNTSAPFNVRVGDVPKPDFSWSAICNNELTKFEDESNAGNISTITSYTWDFGDGQTLTGPAGQSVPAGTNGGSTEGTFEAPNHKYTSFGTYDAKITVLTNDGCANSLTKRVFILPYNTAVVTAVGKFEDFEANSGGWIAEAFSAKNSPTTNISDPSYVPSDTSWVWGPPTGLTITSAAGGSSNAWWTGGNLVVINGVNTRTYYPNENSAVNGPCFDLTLLKRPMISFDYFADIERNVDGVVLQYSINGGLNWNAAGTITQGINWFNGSAITANPGSQPIGNFGWTDKQGKWKNARFNLDMIPLANRSQVRLRFALGSNDGNASGATFDGFAFDNVFVGDKSRNVLVEHFSNANQTISRQMDARLNLLYQEQLSNPTRQGNSDFHDIQYHTKAPQPDQLFLDNFLEQDARYLFYQVSEPPFTIMDGLFKPVRQDVVGLTTDLNAIEIDRRALKDTKFRLRLDTTATGVNNTISVRMTIDSDTTINSPLIAQVALIENQVTLTGAVAGTYRHIFRKNLLGTSGEGETISQGLVLGQQATRGVTNFEIKVPISNPGQLKLVGYIQDRNTREIYQSVVINAPFKRGGIVVGLDKEDISIADLEKVQVYPNPANQRFTFLLPVGITANDSWKITDQRGVIVMSGDFANASGYQMEVNVSDLANGMYVVLIDGAGKDPVYRKLIVMNRN